MTTLEEIAQDGQCLLINPAVIRIKRDGKIDIQRIKEILKILRSTNTQIINGDYRALETYEKKTRDSVRELKTKKRQAKKEASKGGINSIELKQRNERERKKAVKNLIKALQKRQLDIREYPPYQKFMDIIRFLDDTLNMRVKYRKEQSKSKRYERVVAAAYFFATFIGQKTAILSNTAKGYLAFLEDTFSVFGQPDFEPFNQKILERLRTTGIRYYNVDKGGFFNLTFDSTIHNTKGGIYLDLESEIDIFREKLQGLASILH